MHTEIAGRCFPIILVVWVVWLEHFIYGFVDPLKSFVRDVRHCWTGGHTGLPKFAPTYPDGS